ALAPDPEDRYGSVDRLAQDLHRFVDRLPVSARPATWAYRGRKFLRRHALGAATAAVALVAAAGMTAFYTGRGQDGRDRATVEGDRAGDAHARAVEQSLRARSEAAKARQMSEFLAGLFRAADPREAGAAELTARQLLDRGAARVDRELAGQ